MYMCNIWRATTSKYLLAKTAKDRRCVLIVATLRWLYKVDRHTTPCLIIRPLTKSVPIEWINVAGRDRQVFKMLLFEVNYPSALFFTGSISIDVLERRKAMDARLLVGIYYEDTRCSWPVHASHDVDPLANTTVMPHKHALTARHHCILSITSKWTLLY